MRKTFLALLMAVFVLSFWIGTADAAWTTGFATAKKVLQNSNSTTLQTQSGATAIIYTLGAGETLATNDTLTITLTGGAKFSATAPTITVSASTSNQPIVGSPTGATTANFKMNDGASVGCTLTLNTNTTIFNVSGVTGNADVSLKAVQSSASGLTIFDSAQSSLTGAAYGFSAPSAMESVYVAAATDTADVSATTGAYTKFTIGTVGSAVNADFTNLCELGNTAPNGQEISANKILWAITGTLAGIASIDDSGASGALTSSDSTGDITSTTLDTFEINTAKTAAYAVNTAALAPAGNLAPALKFTVDGTTAQQTRGFNVAVSLLADGTKWAAHTAQAATSLYTIVRNGTTFATNSVGSRNTIKITDRSGGIGTGGGAISITAWDVDGNSIPASSSATALTLANNGTTSITGSDLAARFPTGTPMKYEIAVESSNAVVTNMKDSTDGMVRTTVVYTSGVGAI